MRVHAYNIRDYAHIVKGDLRTIKVVRQKLSLSDPHDHTHEYVVHYAWPE